MNVSETAHATIPMPPLTAEQTTAIKALKIPVDSFNPGTYWIASIDRESVMPTDSELRMIRSYIDYSIQATYNLTYQERILAKPFPAEGGHVTKIFRKGGKWLDRENALEGWVFRRITWDGGLYWPTWPAPRLSLMDLLDYINSYNAGVAQRGVLDESWVKWKQAHPTVFQPSPV
jgi:hypothetical protein